MRKTLKKRGRKIWRKFSRVSHKASEEGRESFQENIVERVQHVRQVRLLVLEWCLLVAVLILLAVAQLIWFRGTYSELSFVNGGTFTEATVGRVSSLNPLFAATNSEKALSRLLFSTLVTDDYTGHLGMGLAEAVTPSEDGKVWTVRLREDLKWSDGEPLTVEDVIFTLELIQNPAVVSVYNSNLANVKIARGDEREVVLTLPSAYTDFLAALVIPIVPQHKLAEVPAKTLIENEFSNTPVGSGVFTFNALQSSTVDGEDILYLSANPYYYGKQPMLSSFAVHTYASSEAVVAAINNGAVTATAEIDEGLLGEVKAAQFEVHRTPINAGAYLFFNTEKRWLDNAEMRAALRQGIDMETVRAAAPDTLALDYPLLASQIELASYPALPQYDYEAAAARIQELTGGEKIHLTIATVKHGYLPAVATAVAEQLQKLGIEAEVATFDENQEFASNVAGRRNYDILIYEIDLGVDVDPLPYYHSSQTSATGLNLANYRSVLVDDLLLGARETLDDTLRARKYEKFLEYWISDVPAIGIYQVNLTYVYNRNARAFGENVKLVRALDRFVDVGNWAVTKGTMNMTP